MLLTVYCKAVDTTQSCGPRLVLSSTGHEWIVTGINREVIEVGHGWHNGVVQPLVPRVAAPMRLFDSAKFDPLLLLTVHLTGDKNSSLT